MFANKESALVPLQAWRTSVSKNEEGDLAQAMAAILHLYKTGEQRSYGPILPLLLRLKGEPYTLRDHFFFEPLFELQVPINMTLLAGRQLAKSTGLASSSVVQAAAIPYFNRLTITPLFEQVRRFSNNYIRPFINGGPLRGLLLGEAMREANNVLQRSFANGSTMFFSYALADAERVRGISCDAVDWDECQDANPDHEEVVNHTMSASKRKWVRYSGTPKDPRTMLSQKFRQSSQAHWLVRCDVCGKFNLAKYECQLLKMIGKGGPVCAFCDRTINMRSGCWYHTASNRELVLNHPGYHLPQIIMPWHYEDPLKWAQIIMAMASGDKVRFLNECLGVEVESFSRLVSEPQLQAACDLPRDNTLAEALKALASGRYTVTTMGVDWTGGGAGVVRRVRGKMIVEGGSKSFTVFTICGWISGSAFPEVLYTERVPGVSDPAAEIQRVLELAAMFKVYRIAHDYGGSGNLRQHMMELAGAPAGLLFPCMDLPISNGPLVQYQPPSDTPGAAHRDYYKVDKTRSLILLTQLLKSRCVHLPRYESCRLVVDDFLSLVEDHRERPQGSDITLIVRDPALPDDFCHSLNLGCLAHWHSQDAWPDTTEVLRLGLTKQQMIELYPSAEEMKLGWSDLKTVN